MLYTDGLGNNNYVFYSSLQYFRCVNGRSYLQLFGTGFKFCFPISEKDLTAFEKDFINFKRVPYINNSYKRREIRLLKEARAKNCCYTRKNSTTCREVL